VKNVGGGRQGGRETGGGETGRQATDKTVFVVQGFL